MASDLSSGCTEVNELFDDEKEEGEISLEDVSSSEEGQPYKYPPRAFGQCPYCLSTQHCATWCRSLTVNKNNIVREAHRPFAEDAGLQGKENRSGSFHHHKDNSVGVELCLTSGSSKAGVYSTLQEKNDEQQRGGILNNNDLVPISSGSELESDMELVGLASAKVDKKTRRRAMAALRKSAKPRKKRRKKEAQLSLSPSSVDLAISLKESIHRTLDAGHSKSSRHRSPDKKKLVGKTSPTPRRRRSPTGSRIRASTPVLNKHRRSPPRKTSPLRPRKILSKKLTAQLAVSVDPEMPALQSPSMRGNVTKLLKKVRRLEPFSSRSKEKGSSLKDKLSNIIKKKKVEETETIVTTTTTTTSATTTTTSATTTTVATTVPTISVTTTLANEKVDNKKNKIVGDVTNNKNKIVEDIVDKTEPAVISKDKEPVKEQKKEIALKKENKEEDDDDDDDLVVLRQIALETKHKKNIGILRPDQIKIEPVDEPPPPSPPELEPEPRLPPPSPCSQKLPNFCIDDNDEDLELRMIALRSAVLKKHHTRMLRKKEAKSPPSPVPRIESPFTSTFIDDFPLLAEICNPSSPLGKKDIYCLEDMELDSDIELDKEIAAMSDTELPSPYSPRNDITEHLLLDMPPEPASVQLDVALPKKQDVQANASLYSPSNPTETPNFKVFAKQEVTQPSTLDGSFLELANQESRPYSPTDATIYDPDLPGVHSGKQPSLQPLQPPPMPPLNIFNSQPIMLGCPPNLLNAFMKPVPSMLPLPTINSFPAIHQSVNSLLMPAAIEPVFAYSAAPPPTVLASSVASASATNLIALTPTPISPTTNVIALTPSPISPTTNVNTAVSEPSAIRSSSILDNFGETDLDGSPLVPMEKEDTQQHTSWPLLGEPLYLQGVPNITQSNVTKIPVLMEKSLVPTAVLKSNKQLQHKPLIRKILQPSEHVTEGAFKNADMTPVPLDPNEVKTSAIFKPIKLNTVVKKGDLTTHPAAAFNVLAEDQPKIVERTLMEPPKQTQITTSMAKARRSVTPSAATRKRRRRRLRAAAKRELRESTPLSERWKELGSRALKEKNLARESSSDKSDNTSKEENKLSRLQEKRRRGSVEDDEETLRQLLLASMAKRSKEQPTARAQTLEPLTTDTNSKTPMENNEPAQSEILAATVIKPKDALLINKPNNVAAPKMDSSQIPKQPMMTLAARVTTTSTAASVSQLKRPANMLLSVEQPLRKMVKKSNIIPASTKVVNNAKRYQNALLQRKLNQQQKQNALIAASLKSRFKVNHSISAHRSGSPQIPKPETKRIVINLNEDTDTESESDESTAKISPIKERPEINVPKTDFEMSVVQFLKDVRQQQEMAASATSSNDAASSPKATVKTALAQPQIVSTAISNVVTTKSTTLVSSTAELKTDITTSNNAITTSNQTVATSMTAATATSSSTVAEINVTASSVVPKTVVTSSNVPSIVTVTTSEIVSMASVSSIASKTAVTVSNTTTRTPITAPSTTLKIPITAPSTTSKIPTTAPSTTSKIPTTAPSTTSKIPITAPGTKPKTSVKAPKTPITAPKTPITAPKISSKTVIALTKEKMTVSTPKILKTGIQMPGISATPQAVKHLSASQQEEYRRLKQEIYEREKLRLQKSKEATSVTTTTASSMLSEKLVNNSSNFLSPPVSTSSVLVSSTPKTALKSQITPLISTSSLVKPREVLTLNKAIPKMQLVATISPMSKQNIEPIISTNKAPIVCTSTKIIHSTLSVSKDNGVQSKTTLTNATGKNNVAPVSKTTSQLSGVNAQDMKQQAALLDKMNNSLNNQRKQISAAAQKITTLKILKKEQMNTENSQLQQATNSDSHFTTDLSRSGKAELKSTNNVDRETVLDESVSVSSMDASTIANSSLTESRYNENQSSTINTSITRANTSKHSWEDFKQSVNEEVQSLLNLPLGEQKELLSKTEEQLITKRHLVLDDITEMSGNLRQWEIERDLQNTLSIEVKKLREQLRIAENKLQQQKDKLNSLQPKVQTYHEKINTGRKECFRLSKICNELGQQVNGSKYKVPTTGAELLNNRIKEVAIHTQKLKSKKLQSTEPIKSNDSTKTNKTKNNSNLNSKRKEIIKKQKNNKLKETTLFAFKLKNMHSDVNVDCVNNTKHESSLMINDNMRSNMDNATNTIIKNESIETSTETSTFTIENIVNTPNETPLINTVDSISEFRTNGNIETLDNNVITNNKLETMSLNPTIKTENNIENQVSLLNTSTVNLIVNQKTTTNNNEPKLSMGNGSSNAFLTTENLIQPKTEDESVETNISSNVIVNSTINSETERQIERIFNNSLLEEKDMNSKSENRFTDYRDQNAISSSEINLQNESSLTVTDTYIAGPISNNTESENEKEFSDSGIEKSALILENAINSRSDDQSDLRTFKDNAGDFSIIGESIITLKNENLLTDAIFENSVPMTETILQQESITDINFKDSASIQETIVQHDSNKSAIVDNISTKLKSSEISIAPMEDDTITEAEESLVETQNQINDLIIHIINNIEKESTSAEIITTNLGNREDNYKLNNRELVKINRVYEINEELKHQENILENNQSNTSKTFTNAEHFTLLEEEIVPEAAVNNIKKSEVIEMKRFSEQVEGIRSSQIQHHGFKKKAVQPYESILKHFNVSRNYKTNGILCPYELMGTCNDGDCRFIHQTTSHCQ